jgi:hypothetical protein
MKEAGVRTGFADRIVGRHHLEGVQEASWRKGAAWAKRKRRNRF